MRAPLLDGGEAAVLSVNLDGLFDNKGLDSKLHRLKLGAGRGVRDLTAFENGLLVVAGRFGWRVSRRFPPSGIQTCLQTRRAADLERGPWLQ
jgi:hypothetical protein